MHTAIEVCQWRRPMGRARGPAGRSRSRINRTRRRIGEVRGAPESNSLKTCLTGAHSLQREPVANIKSQIKRNKTNEKARLRNKSVKSEVKTTIRKFHEAAESGDVAAAQDLARRAGKQLDIAVSKGVLHKNQAANRKSAVAAKAASL